MLASFGNSLTKGPAAVAAHAGFGFLLFINACVLVVFALTVRHTAVRICLGGGLAVHVWAGARPCPARRS